MNRNSPEYWAFERVLPAVLEERATRAELSVFENCCLNDMEYVRIYLAQKDTWLLLNTCMRARVDDRDVSSKTTPRNVLPRWLKTAAAALLSAGTVFGTWYAYRTTFQDWEAAPSLDSLENKPSVSPPVSEVPPENIDSGVQPVTENTHDGSAVLSGENTTNAVETEPNGETKGEETMNAKQLTGIVLGAGILMTSSMQAESTLEARWTGGGADKKWQTAENWIFAGEGGAVDGANVVFGADGRTLQTVVGNQITGLVEIASLHYTNSSAFPAPTVNNAYWHVTEIANNGILRISGATAETNALWVGGYYGSGKNITGARYLGDGELEINAPGKNLLLFNKPSSSVGTSTLNLKDLPTFSAAVSNFICGGIGVRAQLTLPVRSNAVDTITANLLSINGSVIDGSATVLEMGSSNLFFCSEIQCSRPDDRAGCSTAWRFGTGLENPYLRIRGKDGESPCSTMTIGSLRDVVATSPYSAISEVAWTNGHADVRLDSLSIGEGRGFKWSSQNGECRATLLMGHGNLEAGEIRLGTALPCSTSGAASAFPATGELLIYGGTARAGKVFMAHSESANIQSAVGRLGLFAGAALSVDETVVLGNREGDGNANTSIVQVCGGTLTVARTMCPGENNTHCRADITVSNGCINVTNEFRIEEGRLTLGSAGILKGGRVILTNTAAEVSLLIGKDGATGAIEASDRIVLGGNLIVSDDSGLVNSGNGKTWRIIQSSIVEGSFAQVSLPPEMKIHYATQSVSILYSPKATRILLF